MWQTFGVAVNDWDSLDVADIQWMTKALDHQQRQEQAEMNRLRAGANRR